ncbi:uncharacterized protein LOC107263164 [Cephus cinctus]|uniref:Uncharacterized protein LOC107263164 n=1 Tax=Cephus cinctus TaxID=211228 RepID=A0AAJ7BH69_CEPCN|nr:uncharacterized protein LOC107263164 [Cephus cinctus]
MAYAPLPKLIPISSTKLYPKESTKTSLSEILQSDPVKRLFNQPNIVIETIPVGASASSSTVLNKSIFVNKKNGTRQDLHGKNQPEISILPVRYVPGENKEEGTHLPSKKDGKSEITLLPIKRERKKCGHYEPCENIVCDVAVQQYIDHNGVSPMLAVNIEPHEINAPVSKHCKNTRCDTLSIDHNRCRRALIKLYRCDTLQICDICGIKIKTRKAFVRHKKCNRKEEYRHNETDGAQILKERMRERELQMMEASRTKRNEYVDPDTEYNRVIEALKKNEELIVIPKSVPPQPPIITITSIPNSQANQQYSSVKDVFGKLLPSIPIVFPHQSILLGKRTNTDSNNGPATKQSKLQDFLNNTLISPPTSGSMASNQFIKLAGVSQGNIVQPVTINDWLVSQAQIVGSSTIQPKPFFTPIRVVPITNLKSPPSLLHQTQGIPKFCIMADNTLKPPALIKSQSVQSTAVPIVPDISIKVKSDKDQSSNATTTASTTTTTTISKAVPLIFASVHQRRRSDDKNGKSFVCTFCPKRFSTDWYFKMHLAKHKGETPFSCKTCNQQFTNRYDMKKHLLNDHKTKEGEQTCGICGHVSLCYSALEVHMRSHTGEKPFKCDDCENCYRVRGDLKIHQRKVHGFADCSHCNEQFNKTELKEHLMTIHDVTEEEAEKEVNDDDYLNGRSPEDMEKQSKENSSDPIKVESSEKKSEERVEEKPKEEIAPAIQKSPVSVAKKCNGLTKKKEDAKQNGKAKKSPTVTVPRRRSTRRGNSGVQCNVCEKHFVNANLLKAHLADKPKKVTECLDCGKKFHTLGERNRHPCEKIKTTTSPCPSVKATADV